MSTCCDSKMNTNDKNELSCESDFGHKTALNAEPLNTCFGQTSKTLKPQAKDSNKQEGVTSNE